MTAPTLWTREEREAWKHGVLGRLGDGETAILDVRSGEFNRILATVDALEKALREDHHTQHTCEEQPDICALLAQLEGK